MKKPLKERLHQLYLNSGFGCPMGVVLEGDTQREKALKYRISQLKKREKQLREERHRLESELRETVFNKYARLGENISSKLKEL